MNKYLLSFLLLAPGLASAQTPFTLKGTIGKLNAPAKVYLLRDGSFADSVALNNGAFELKGTLDRPVETMLILQRQGRVERVFQAETERLTLLLEPGLVPTLITSPDSLAKAAITGGPLTTDFQQLQTALRAVVAREQGVQQLFARTPPAEQQTPAFRQRIRAEFEATGQLRRQVSAAFIKAHPDSWVSLNALLRVGDFYPQYAYVGPLYAALSPRLQRTPEGQAYGQRLPHIKAVSLGAQAPDFSQKTPEGKTVSLRDLRGKYVLVDFWASWCGPCRQENPNLRQAYSQYKSRNFEVLGVSLDDEKSRDKWVQAIKDDQLPWLNVSDLKGRHNELATRYDVQSVPQNYLVDPSGKIIAYNLRGEDLQDTLARLIK